MTTATPPLTETQFLGQVLELAALLGWAGAHFRPALTSRGWRTPIQGSLGKGWPDLTLVRPRDGRLLFAELKVGKARPTDDQGRVIEVLRSTKAEVYLWTPEMWPEIEAVLR